VFEVFKTNISFVLVVISPLFFAIDDVKLFIVVVLLLISDVFLLTLISKLLNVCVDIVDDGFVVICVKEFTLTFKEFISLKNKDFLVI
jgi:hypothetical protein